MEIRPVTDKEYEEFGKKQKNWTFSNSAEQANRFKKEGKTVQFLGGFVDGKMMAAAMAAITPVAKIYNYAYIPDGFLLDWNDPELIKDFAQSLKQYFKKENVLYYMTNPYLILKERDENGDLVENGQDNTPIVKAMEEAGFFWEPTVPGYHPKGYVTWMSVLDLNGRSWQQLLKDMDQQTRWSINRAAKYDLLVREAESEKDYDDFQKMMEHTGARNGFEAHSASYYKEFKDAFGDKASLQLAFIDTKALYQAQKKLYDEAENELKQVEAKLETAPNSKKMLKKKKVLLEAMELAESKMQEALSLEKEHGDMILLAGSLFCSTDDETTYLYSGAYDTYMKYNAPYSIHAHMIRKAIEEGKKRYNFYGISGNFGKEEEGYPLFNFKKGFGCNVWEMIGLFTMPVKDTAFSLYNKVKHVI